MSSWYVIVPFVALLMTVFAGAAVYGQHRRDPANRAFLLFALTCSVWLVGEVITHLPVAAGHEMLILRLMCLFWVPTGLLSLNLAYALLGRRYDGPFWLCLGLTLAGMVAGIMPGVAFTGFGRHPWGLSVTLNPIGFPFVFASLIGAAIYGTVLLVRGWRAEPSRNLRRPLTLVIAGAGVTLLIAPANNILLPLVLGPDRVPRLGAAATVAFTYSILFAVTHYSFLSRTVEGMAEELFDNIHDGIVVTGPKGQILRMNRTARDLLADPDHTPSGQRVSSMLPAWDPTDEHGERTVTVNRNGRKHILSLSMLATRHMGGLPIRVRLLRDITEEHEAERALRDKRDDLEAEARRRTEQLTQIQRMEAISTLASGIAHDFNNLLTVIVGSTSAARDDLPEGHEARGDLDAVLRAARRGRDTVRQIMSLSQIDPPDKRDIAITHLVRDTLQLLEKSLPADILVEHSFCHDATTVVGYQTQLQRAIINLYTNAIQAMRPSKGVLRVELSVCQVDAELASRHPHLTPGSHVCLSISDTGAGMPQEVTARIFEPFFTTKPQGEGTGLGLSTTQQIVHNHDGAITVESEPGQGSTFVIYLPAMQRPSPRLVSEVLTVDGGNEHILLVDDNEPVARAGRWMLEALGYKVTTVHSGPDALEAFGTDTFDLVITDQTMPEMSGSELATELRQLNPLLPIILVSGYMEGVEDRLPGELDNVRFLPKPLSRDHLGMLVRKLLDR